MRCKKGSRRNKATGTCEAPEASAQFKRIKSYRRRAHVQRTRGGELRKFKAAEVKGARRRVRGVQVEYTPKEKWHPKILKGGIGQFLPGGTSEGFFKPDNKAAFAAGGSAEKACVQAGVNAAAWGNIAYDQLSSRFIDQRNLRTKPDKRQSAKQFEMCRQWALIGFNPKHETPTSSPELTVTASKSLYSPLKKGEIRLLKGDDAGKLRAGSLQVPQYIIKVRRAELKSDPRNLESWAIPDPRGAQALAKTLRPK